MHNHQAFQPGNTGAVLVAAGSGKRLGGEIPKQFQPLGGKPVLRWSVDALLRCDKIRALAVVVSPSERARTAALLPSDSRISLVDGGAERTDSVRNGLRALEGKGLDSVLIHDAARPGLSACVVDELIAALAGADAAAPALPVADALKDTRNGVRTVSREGLVRIQTPQAFRFDVISRAIASATGAVDDIALVEATGAKVVLTPGRQELMKITHPEDLAIAEKLLSSQQTMRVGTGFDVHGFTAGDHVTICGVRIPHTKTLEGHSDADVGWHALTDAILGAAALGDIGDHFPPSDLQWKGADSLVFLQHAAKLAAERGFRVVNADITLLCEKPKISPHREAMRTKTAEALGIPLDCVSVKATTTERLGFLGREEGIAAQAVVMLSR
ncbi:MAG TPA: bifunctional 2-C-methyl-D-erythritol 4-phosphate cytidylyltransferase/2-C-methyl-D-erythritol 2,4-cyclodiphosphate synthase [Hyphomonadaceae bacterium]|jgi:2-C-methyl-D-erythritol 4-phosphate cytidylyltransferase/2-C-methyl-D-erythritol 2,4-cyclodiphosphate synthase|nr:bifunctional 2-C-methyl-D-erythritol 4-phosphate cytidylyltransferase/2-C-methyl-D-erythritol 2,4-cyclodiphosphate synthase [Hyphomonadaceae bacterium]